MFLPFPLPLSPFTRFPLFPFLEPSLNPREAGEDDFADGAQGARGELVERVFGLVPEGVRVELYDVERGDARVQEGLVVVAAHVLGARSELEPVAQLPR